MSGKFANMYWSADYKSGIDKLANQSSRSVKQLHELRKLVFNYMQYFHSNSEYLNRLGIESYTFESGFRPIDSVDPTEFRLKKPNVRKVSGYQARTISQAERNLNSVKTIKKNSIDSNDKPISEDKKASPVSMADAYELCVKNISDESHTLINLASVIDREILEGVTDFIKIYEPRILGWLKVLRELLSDYEATHKELESIEIEFNEYSRLKEFSGMNLLLQPPDARKDNDNEELMTQMDSPSSDSNSRIIEEPKPSAKDEIVNVGFEFPLTIGTVKAKTLTDFISLMQRMISAISTIKRKIPLPGYRNEIFSSDQLCEWLLRHRPFGLNPSRMNMEKFGQSLLDLKLIVTTGIWSKKFKSEGMWFEWSDQAIQYANNESLMPGNSNGVVTNIPKVLIEDSNSTSKFMNEMAENTSKRFNGLFNTVKSSILKNNYSEHLEDLQGKYNESYLELQNLRHLLDLEIAGISQELEKFEKIKIELVYKSLTTLHEIMYNFSLNATSRLHKLTSEYIVNINLKENHSIEFEKLLDDFNTGIYFPTSISPNHLAKHQFSAIQLNKNFQNLKYQFNLYKDIPLQPLLAQSGEAANQLLSTSSLPIFLYQLVNIIEESEKREELDKYWQNPIDHEINWSIKELIINRVNIYAPESEIDASKELEIHKDMTEKIISHLRTLPTSNLVSFLKAWLLEISDSLLPCMVFDSVINNYKADLTESDVEGKQSRMEELVKILGSIPRSNLSSLIFIFEHICDVFDLGHIPGYGFTDELAEELIEPSDESKLNEIAKVLNSMDAIGAIPFVHLILRPSPTKHSSGFKPPLQAYRSLLSDLFNIEVRSKLFHSLITQEKNFKYKKENEKKALNIQIKKLAQPSKPDLALTIVNTLPKSPNKRLSGGEDFTLRPFRTKPTPNPTPSNSPRHTPQNSLDINEGELKIKKQRDKIKGDNGSVTRSSSATFLAPNINIEFEE